MNATLRIERTFHAPAQAVFDSWTSEVVLRRWWHAGHNWETSEASVDLRVGGGGRYTEIDPPHRLAFTWLWDDNDIRQLIEIDFEEIRGVTTVRLTTRDLWEQQAVRAHKQGWGLCLDNLERVLAEDLATER